MSVLLQLKDVTFEYTFQKEKKVILDHASYSFDKAIW